MKKNNNKNNLQQTTYTLMHCNKYDFSQNNIGFMFFILGNLTVKILTTFSSTLKIRIIFTDFTF